MNGSEIDCCRLFYENKKRRKISRVRRSISMFWLKDETHCSHDNDDDNDEEMNKVLMFLPVNCPQK